MRLGSSRYRHTLVSRNGINSANVGFELGALNRY